MSLMKRALALQRANVLHRAAYLVSHDRTLALRWLKLWRMTIATPRKGVVPLAHMLNEVEKWIACGTTHESVSAVVDEVLSSPGMDGLFDVQDALAMRHFLGAIGLFAAAEQLLVRSLEAVLASDSAVSSPREVRRLARAAILSGDPDRAKAPLTALRRLPGELITDALTSYLTLWLHSEAEPPETVLIGPAPATLRASDVATMNDSKKVIRVLMPGATEWVDPTDPVNGHTDVVYANGQTSRWLSELPSTERALLLSKFNEVVVKHDAPWVALATNVRVAPQIGALYFSGNPNMAQIIAFDQLSGPERHIFVSGVSFFLGATAYRIDQRREFQDSGVVSNSMGSTGRMFERCSSIASHDQTTNRALLRNLLHAGSVSGSLEFTDALNLDNLSFCAQLDQKYGKARL